MRGVAASVLIEHDEVELLTDVEIEHGEVQLLTDVEVSARVFLLARAVSI